MNLRYCVPFVIALVLYPEVAITAEGARQRFTFKHQNRWILQMSHGTLQRVEGDSLWIDNNGNMDGYIIDPDSPICINGKGSLGKSIDAKLALSPLIGTRVSIVTSLFDRKPGEKEKIIRFYNVIVRSVEVDLDTVPQWPECSF